MGWHSANNNRRGRLRLERSVRRENIISGNLETDRALGAKGYGTFDSNGKLLNVDNYWRKDNAEAEGFDWFGILPNTKAYWQYGFKVHYEDYFEPQNRSPFSPLPDNLFSQEGAYIGALLIWLLKNRPDTFEKLANNYITTCGNIVSKIMESGKASPYAAINSHTAAACVLHRLGLITNGGYLKIVDQSRNMISVLQQLAALGKVLDGLTSLVEGASVSAGAGAAPTKGLGILADLYATGKK